MNVMLLPSAFACPSQPSRRARLQPSLFTSPPASPPPSAPNTLYQTCIALQSMLSSPVAAPSAQEEQERQPELPLQRQLPTPPMRNAPLPSPMKLRLRSHKTSTSASTDAGASSQLPRKRVMKRSTPPPRGANKRRREASVSDDEEEEESRPVERDERKDQAPSTPKRIRVAPETLPLGLERRDFELLYESHQYSSENALGINSNPPGPSRSQQRDSEQRAEGEEKNEMNEMGIDWSSEEDRQLVDLVLQKLKLTKSDWHDCARTLGRDSACIGRRWKSLMENGEVGLKGRSGRIERSRKSSTWR